MSDRFGLPKGIVIIEDFGWGYCKRYGKYQDLRFGVCFDCATEEEKQHDLELLGIKEAEQ